MPTIELRIHLRLSSSQTLAGLTTSVKNNLVEAVKTATLADEDSQDADPKTLAGKGPQSCVKSPVEQVLELTHVTDRIPGGVVKALIEKLAERKNYGLEAADLSQALPDGVKQLPLVSSDMQTRIRAYAERILTQALQLWTWELHSLDMLPADCQAKVAKRRAEREKVSWVHSF